MVETCNDPTDLPVGKIVVPFSTVFIGGAPTKVGSGSSSASGDGGGGAGTAVTEGESAEGEGEAGEGGGVSEGEGGVTPAEGERTHWVEFKFNETFSGRKFLLLLPDGTEEEGTLGSDGNIRKENIPIGQAQVLFEGLRNARWSSPEVAPGKPVELIVDAVFCKEGTQVKFEIFREFKERKKNIIKSISAKVERKQARAEWQYEYDEKDAGKIARFIFKATLGKYHVTSNILEVGDEIEVKLEDEEGNPLIHTPYVIMTSGKKEREGNSDDKGWVKEKMLPLGKSKIILKEGEEITPK